MKKEKKKINWKRTLKNNGYMIGLIMKACPGVFVLGIISTILGATHSFLLNTYLYKYALNALQEGKELKTVLITLACMFSYSIMYKIFCCAADCYFGLKYPVVESYIQNLLQKKSINSRSCLLWKFSLLWYICQGNERGNRQSLCGYE